MKEAGNRRDDRRACTDGAKKAGQVHQYQNLPGLFHTFNHSGRVPGYSVKSGVER